MEYLMLAALLPAALLIWYIRKQDRFERESVNYTLTIAGFGAATVISALILESLGKMILRIFLEEDSTLYTALHCFLVVAVAEELGKFAVLRLRTWHSREFNYTYDAVVYAVAASLGFAALENVLYVMSGGFFTAIARAVTAIPGHATFGVFMGCHYGLSRRADARGFQRESDIETLKALFVPIVLHGFYDFCLFMDGWYWSGIFFVFYLAAIAAAFRTVKKLSEEDSPLDLDQWYENHK